MNLFQATELARIEHHIDDDGLVNVDSLDSANIAVKDKQIAVLAFVKNNRLNIKQVKDVIKELEARVSKMVRKDDSLTDYLAVNMKFSNTTEIIAENSTFSAKLYLDRDVSLQWVEGVAIPDAFCTVKHVVTHSKTLAREAIERGEPVACAVIIRKDRLTISGD